MGKINMARVFLGGIVAGAFTVAMEYLGVFLLPSSLSLHQVTGVAYYSAARQFTFAAVVILVGGPLAIWIYAAIRPRFGAGPRTAVIAAVWIWLVVGPYMQALGAIVAFMKPMPLGMVVTADIMGLPFIMGAVLIGAWLYKEEGAPAALSRSISA